MSKVYEEKSTTYYPSTGKRHSREDGLDKLPSELVTNDPADPARIHAVDPDHVRHDIMNEYIKAGGKPNAPDLDADKRKKYNPYKGQVSTKGQEAVDIIRLSVMSAVLGTCISDRQAGREPNISVRHIWFPKDDLSEYELRPGNPPADSDRPKHLKNLRLEIDPTTIPDYLERAMQKNSAGQSDLSELKSLRNQMYTGQIEKPSILIG